MRPFALLLAVSLPLAVLACAKSGDDDDDGSTPALTTYHEHVEAILQERCLACHVDGGVAPFSLEGYANANALQVSIQVAASTRLMPPWGVDNSGACRTWKDARWLSDAELATIDDWIADGAQQGDPAAAPTPIPTPTSIRVDTVLTTGTNFTPVGSPDEYRCFLVDPAIPADRYVTALQVTPGEPRVVHHMILYSLDTAQAEADAVALDDASPDRAGYPCFGGVGVSESRWIAGWAPGVRSSRYPTGTGVELIGGRQAVLQIHYNTLAGSLVDPSTKIELELETTVAKPALIALLSDNSINLPPGETDATAGVTYTMPANATLHGVFPHMHKRGRTMRVDVNGTCAMDVPRWDFNWQQLYFYEQPIQLQSGDTIDVACHYDTTGDTAPITFGEGTDDEMCVLISYLTF